MAADTNVVTLTVAIVGAVTGVSGLVLSIINTWKNWDRDRVKLKVTPISVKDKNGSGFTFGIEIVNLSSFPVTISDVGIKFKRNDVDPVRFVSERVKDGNRYQEPAEQRLQSREAVFLTCPDLHGAITLSAYNAEYAYVRTACGAFAKTRNDALQGRAAKTTFPDTAD